MPVRRRVPKHRAVYPEAIERLISGQPIEETDENRNLLIAARYFGEWPDLAPEIRERAGETLAGWR